MGLTTLNPQPPEGLRTRNRSHKTRERTGMKKGRILLGLGVAVATLAAWGTVPVGATGGGGPIAQSVLGSGSDTTQIMMNSLDQLYLYSPGCQQIPNPGGTAWYDFSCLSPDPAGTIKSENYEHDQVHEAYF